MKRSVVCRRLESMSVFRCEDGFTTVGMVIALLVTLSLVFTAAQVYRLNAASSKVQNVADAAALAAQNEVAEFMIIVHACDAVVLSLSLTSLVATGLGVAALCTPATAAASDALLKAGREVARARDGFAEKASAGLGRLQRALPFLAAVNAASVASANDRGTSNYLALAMLVPAEGEEIAVGEAAGAAELEDAVDQDAEEVKRAAEEAERAAARANEAKLRGFEHDCGANPSYCMYERAQSLASLAGDENPLFSSVDTWSFSVALERAQAYYPARLALEAPEGSSVREHARSELRKRFYSFATEEVGRGYVHEEEGSFEALFPHLPKNTEEMRATTLYTEAVYPVTRNASGSFVMHAWAGCPVAVGAGSFGSIAQMEAGSYPVCDRCEFTAASMGKVAAASTSIQNGFEYQYEATADAASEYAKARAELDPLASEVKQQAGGLFDRVEEALGAVSGMRIDARPPGSLGVVVLAVDRGREAASTGFESSFVRSTGILGARAAVSSATLLAEPANEGANVVSSLLDGLSGEGGQAVGVLGAVLDCWSALLSAYAEGQEVLDGAVAEALDALPLASASGLGTWAAGALREAVSAAGLEPAKLDALKPVLVNSVHVAQADDGVVSARLLFLKEQAVANPLASNDVFSSIVSSFEQTAVEGIESFEGTLEIAVVELCEGGPAVTIEVSLPAAAKHAASDFVQRIADGLRSVYAQMTGVRAWD